MIIILLPNLVEKLKYISKGWGSENVSRMILICFYLSQKASDHQISCVYLP